MSGKLAIRVFDSLQLFEIKHVFVKLRGNPQVVYFKSNMNNAAFFALVLLVITSNPDALSERTVWSVVFQSSFRSIREDCPAVILYFFIILGRSVTSIPM